MVRNVIKRDGSVEEFNSEKLNKWAEWASDTCGVSWSEVLLTAVRTMPETISTSTVHQTLIKTCIEFKDKGHVKMAARLLLGQIYKEAFNGLPIPHLTEFYHKMVEAELWDDMGYTDTQLETLNGVLNHERDFDYEYATLRQFYDKYAISVGDECRESPQLMMMGLAMSNNRTGTIEDVITAYQAISELKINLPTPTLNGERTTLKGSPSCCVITAGDHTESIGAATHVAYQMTGGRAGIGIEYATRSVNDPVKNGRVAHTGKFPLYAYVDKAVKALTQVGRGGSATVTYTCMDPEIEMLLRLKSQRTDIRSRLDHMDYSFAVNNLFLGKVAKNEEWMLVSSYWAPKLHELFYSKDVDAYVREYERVLNDDTVKKTLVSARTIMDTFLSMRNDTGRVYLTLINNVNQHTPFLEPVRLSNLCQEICLVTAPLRSVKELYDTSWEDSEIALCFLASLVVSRLDTVEDYINAAYIAARTIDNTIDNTAYPYPQMEMTAKARRNIGVGMTDVAHWMAKQGVQYDTEEGRNAIHRLAELHSYALHKASVRLAKERGPCEWLDKTGYSAERPWLPIDTYRKAVDEHHSQELLCDWEGLREDIKKYGMRFSVVEAFMPVESSSVFTSSVNGLYPIRNHQIYKKSKKGTVFFEAPGWDELKDVYQNAYDVDHLDLVKFYSIVQKFTGQAISADFYTDLRDGKKQSMRDLYQRVFLAAKLGMKTFYYENFLTVTAEESPIEPELEDDTSCEACTL